MKLDTKLPDVLTLEEIEKLIDSAREIRNKAIIALLYSSGLRVGQSFLTGRLNDRLFAMLPYKSLCFTSIKDRHGVYAMINKDERRDVSIRKPRPSIRKQLADSKQATSPKKAAARTKKNELEVWGMMHFTVEEENLICMYHNADRRRTIGKITAAMAGIG